MIFAFLVMSKNGKKFLQILHRYIDFANLLPQYIRISVF